MGGYELAFISSQQQKRFIHDYKAYHSEINSIHELGWVGHQ